MSSLELNVRSETSLRLTVFNEILNETIFTFTGLEYLLHILFGYDILPMVINVNKSFLYNKFQHKYVLSNGPS